MRIAVVVPTYRRPLHLVRCLAALDRQDRPPDELLVVVRSEEDPAGEAAVAQQAATCRGTRPRPVRVGRPGVVGAMLAGVAATQADIVAVTDDDAVPRPDWLATLLGHYRPGVGGVGGRDVLPWVEPAAGRRPSPVGRVTWWGRQTGNHDVGSGPPREVDVLKGVNLSLRRELWRFDHETAGSGTQVHWEMLLCLRARRLGWRLIYDPGAVVDHFPAERTAGDDRGGATAPDVERAAFRQALAVLAYAGSGPQALCRAGYRIVVGDRGAPGIARAAYGALRRDTSWHHFLPAQRGTWRAVRVAAAERRRRS